MSVAVYKERAEVIGSGAKKQSIVEVLIGAVGIGNTEIDEDSGTPYVKEWVTGATIEDPFGLRLLSQEVCFDRRGVGSNNTIHFGGFVMVNDPDAESGEGILREDNFNVRNILSVSGYSDDVLENSSAGAPLYVKESYNDARLFTAPTLPLEVTAYLSGLGASDSVDVTAKFTFEKVKMSKSAWLEKLAIRSYG
jgi:hypothetical protein